MIVLVVAEKAAPFNINEIWKGSKTGCKPIPTWTNGVQKYYDDIIVAFGKFPPNLLKESTAVTTTFQSYLAELVNSSNSNSTIVSSGSTEILEVLSQVKILANTPIGVINEFYRILPILMVKYRDVVSKLSKVIGSDVACSVNDEMTALESSFKRYMEKFLQTDAQGNNKKIDYGSVTKHFTVLNSTVASFTESTENKCSPVAPNLKDAVTVLNFVLDHIRICFFGLSGCSEAVLYEQKQKCKRT